MSHDPIPNNTLANPDCGRLLTGMPNYVDAFLSIKMRVLELDRVKIAPFSAGTFDPLDIHDCLPILVLVLISFNENDAMLNIY
jgi:hypothetical protein